MASKAPPDGPIKNAAEAQLLKVRKQAAEHAAALGALWQLSLESKGPARKRRLADLDRAFVELGLSPPLAPHVLEPVTALVKNVAGVLQAPNKDH